MSNNFAWMPVYVADLITDEAVKVMTNSEFGIYMKLLFHQWIEGSIPAAPEFLSRIVGEDQDRFNEFWPIMAGKFDPAGEGRLANPKLVEVRAKQDERHEDLAERGRRGGKQRAANAQAKAQAGLEAGLGNGLKPNPSSQSQSQKEETPPTPPAGGKSSFAEGSGEAEARRPPAPLPGDTRWRHFAGEIVKAYPRPGPRGRALRGVCRMLEQMHLEAGDASETPQTPPPAQQTIARALATVKRFAEVTKGAGYLPYLGAWCEDEWWKMAEAEWAEHGRDQKDVAKQRAEQAHSDAASREREQRAEDRRVEIERQQAASQAEETASAFCLEHSKGNPESFQSLRAAALGMMRPSANPDWEENRMLRAMIHKLGREAADETVRA